MQSRLTLWILLLLFTAMSGCIKSAGTDDESDAGNEEGDTTETPAQEVVDLVGGEGESLSRVFASTITNVETIRQDAGITPIVQGETLRIEVGDLENDGIARYEVTDDSGESYIVAVSVTNESALPLIAEAQALAEVTADLVVEDDRRLAEVVLELEYLGDITNPPDIEAARASFETSLASASSQLESSISLVSETLTGYQNGESTETALSDVVTQANSAIASVDIVGAELLLEVRDTLGLLGVPIPTDPASAIPIQFVPEEQRYSRFMTDNFGSFGLDSQFAFSTSFDFLNAVFPYATASSGR